MLRFKYLFFLVGFFLVGSAYSSATKLQKNTHPTLRVPLSDDDQRKFDYYFYDAVSAKAIEKGSEAYDYLQYCMRIDSTNANVLFELGNFYVSVQDKDRGLSYYKKAVEYDQDNFYYNMALAAISVEKELYGDAATIYKRLVELYPAKVELYMYLSEAYRLNEDYPKSIEALDDLERTTGLNEKITLQKFKLYSALNDKKKAYAEVQKYIDKNPDDVRYYLLQANLYIQDNKSKEAYKSLSKAKELDPQNPLLISLFANYYQQIGDKESADRELRASLFNEKTDIDIKIGILTQYVGMLQQNKQGTEQANLLLDSLLIKYPQEGKFNMLYGNLLMLQNKKKEANYQYKLFTESDPSNILGWEQLLQSTDVDSVNALIDVCKAALSYLPEEPLFYFYLSIGEYQKKEYKKAITTLDKGLPYVDSENPALLSEFYSQRGSLFYELGLPDSAFVDYDKALKYNPQNLLVLNNYAYYLSLTGKDLDKAAKMSSITIKAEPTNPTYLDTYGWILFEQGSFSLAKVYLEKAVKYSQEKEDEVSADVLEHFGDVLSKTGNADGAVEYWNKAKEKGSESKTLEQKIETKSYIENNKTKKQ